MKCVVRKKVAIFPPTVNYVSTRAASNETSQECKTALTSKFIDIGPGQVVPGLEWQ